MKKASEQELLERNATRGKTIPEDDLNQRKQAFFPPAIIKPVFSAMTSIIIRC